ncbi:hypothetical protein LCGC14_2971900, partial [marine sediment metagenome]
LIRILKQVEADGRLATVEEQRKLVQYVGWGGIPQVFDYWRRDEWGPDGRELKELLTSEEYDSARASTPNAHFTSETVVRAIWDAVGRLGFEKGRILEPSLGVGHFIGLAPQDINANSRWSGVELDSITGRIGRLLYPESDVRVEGFQDAQMPDNFYDLAISNVPFGNYRIHDPRYRRRFSIHDYFFVKSLDKVRPGGIVAFITSKYTMDRVDSSVRRYIGERAELVGAIRLPNTAFKENANTTVTTDIIILRKRLPGEALTTGETWIETGTAADKKGQSIVLNEYFVRHPEMMLGQMELGAGQFETQTDLVPDERGLDVALREAIAKLPAGAYQERAAVETTAEPEIVGVAPTEVKEGNYTLQENGAIAQ